MKSTSYTLFLLMMLTLLSCAKEFDSAQPWNNPVEPPSREPAKPINGLKLNALVNPYALGKAEDAYYFTNVRLLGAVEKISLYETDGKFFTIEALDSNMMEYSGKWAFRRGTDKKVYIELEKNDGTILKVTQDTEGNDNLYFIETEKFEKKSQYVPSIEAIKHRSCKSKVKGAGTKIRKFIKLGEEQASSQGINYNECLVLFDDYITELKDPVNDTSKACRKVKTKYKKLLKKCNTKSREELCAADPSSCEQVTLGEYSYEN